MEDEFDDPREGFQENEDETEELHAHTFLHVGSGLTNFTELVDETWLAIEQMEHLFDITREKFHQAYPGKSAFIGPPEERHLLHCGNKKSLTMRNSHYEKDNFASVFSAINQSKDENFYTWLSEFIDLIIVATIVKLADFLKFQMKTYITEETDSDGLAQTYWDTFCIFLVFWTAFTNHTFFWIRFTDIPGRLDDCMHLLYGLGLTLMALYIPQQSRILEKPLGFCIGWWVTCTGLLSLHTLCYFRSHSDAGVTYCRRRIIAIVVSMMVPLLVFLDHVNLNSTWFFFATIPILWIEMNSLRHATKYGPAESEALTERCGIFILIMLGESILALILTNVEYPTSDSDKSGIDIGSKQAKEATGVVIFSFFIMACVYIMYFNGHMSEEGKHALDNPGSPGGVVWYIFHVPLGYTLLLVGVGFKYMIYMDEQNFLNPEYIDNERGIRFAQSQICLSLLIAVLCIFIIRTAHLNFYWLIWPSSTVRPLTLIPLVLLALLTDSSSVYDLAAISLAMAFIVAVDLWAVGHEKQEPTPQDLIQERKEVEEGEHRGSNAPIQAEMVDTHHLNSYHE